MLFLPIPVHFRIENPYLFREHMPWDIRTAKLGIIRCIFVEKLPLKVNFKRGCKKPTGVLMVIWSGFLAHTRAFSKEAPTIFRKHMHWGIGTESLGMIRCIFAENGPLEGGIEPSFSDTGWGAKGDFSWIFDTNPYIFEGGPPPFSESTCPQIWAQTVWGWSDVYSLRMGP